MTDPEKLSLLRIWFMIILIIAMFLVLYWFFRSDYWGYHVTYFIENMTQRVYT